MALNFLNNGYFAGKVGIGIVSPTTSLHVDSVSAFPTLTLARSTTHSGISFTAGISNYTGAGADLLFDGVGSDTGFGFRTRNSSNTQVNALVIAPSGNVGIGETSVDARLHISALASNGISNVKLESPGASKWAFGIPASQTYFALDDVNDNLTTPRLVVLKTSGNVGIGVTDPEKKLEVKSDTTYDGIMLDVLSSPEITFRDRGNSDTLIGTGRYALDGFHIDTYSGNAFFIKGSNRFVGIGTATPGAQLHNYSTASTNVFITGYGTAAQNDWGAQNAMFVKTDNGLIISKENAQNNTNRLFNFYNDNSGNATQYIHDTSSTATIKLDSAGDSYLNGGNVGIGTTSPGAKLAISNGGALGYEIDPFNASGEVVSLFSYNRLTSAWKTTRYSALDHRFEINGTTEAMRITSTGGISFGSTGTAYGTSGQILKSNGNASPTWINGSAIPGVPGGSGTLNTVAMWTPDGDTLGNSPITISGNDIISSGRGVIENTTNLTTGVVDSLLIKTLSSGTTITNGFGGGLSFYLENTVYSAVNEVAKIAVIETDTIAIDDKMVFSVKDNNILADRLTLTGSEAVFTGNVGIGTTGPSEKLQVQGNIIVNKDSTAANFVSKTFTTGHAAANRGGSILFGMNDSTPTGMKITTSVATNASYNKQEIEFITHEGAVSVGTRMKIDSIGNVGIGTDSPAALLTLNKVTGAVGILLEGNGTDVGKFQLSSAGVNHAVQIGSVSNNEVQFHTVNSEKMRITPTGDVGIGTTLPNSKLTVWDVGQTFDARTSGINVHRPNSYGQYGSFSYDGAATHFTSTYTGNAAVGYGTFVFKQYNNGTVGRNALEILNDGNFIFNQYAGSALTGTPTYLLGTDASGNVVKTLSSSAPGSLWAANGNDIYNTNSGNVGVGVTPGAKVAGNIRLDIGYVGCGITSRQNAELVLTANADYTTATTTGRAATMLNMTNTGEFYFSTAPAATAGTALTFTTRMTILSGGNVGIGTTLPATDLHVNSENAEGSLTLSRGGNNMVSGQGVGSIVFPADYNGTPTNYGKIVTYANALSALRGSIDLKVKSTSGNLLTGLTVYGTSSGVNVGIGTTSPGSKLEINENSTGTVYSKVFNQNAGVSATARMAVVAESAQLDIIATSAGYTGVSGWADSGVISTDSGASGGLILNAQTGGLKLQTGLSTKMVVLASGDVGIGTTNPQSSLEVVDSANYKGIHVRGNAAPNITFGQNADTTAEWKIGISGFNGDSFSIGTGTSANDKVHIEAGGNVGIGTTGPQSKLQVAGGIQMADDAATAVVGKVGTMRYRTGTEYVEVTGTELVTNSDFSDGSTGWTVNNPDTNNYVTFSGGTARLVFLTTSPITELRSSSVTLVSGTKYRLVVDIASVTSGSVKIDGAGISENFGQAGVITRIIQPTSNTALYFYRATANVDMTFNSVSAVEVTAEDASYADMCMQTGASTYEWVNIVRNTY
mgnify:CR=1 FL=1